MKGFLLCLAIVVILLPVVGFATRWSTNGAALWEAISILIILIGAIIGIKTI